MNTLKLGSSGPDVLFLQAHLGLVPDGSFGPKTDATVREYQKEHGLTIDGVVGPKTWETLTVQSLTEQDFKRLAGELGVDVPALKAIWSVESGGSGFIKGGIRPKILFEGHIFWSELKKKGYNPSSFRITHPGIVYPTWTKVHYLGGEKEYLRLEEAWNISPVAALSSASVGMFQIMGNNWSMVGAESVFDYWAKASLGEKEQLEQFSKFIGKSGILPFLKKHDWATVAKKYNGPGYAKNSYDTKLAKAYNKYNA